MEVIGLPSKVAIVHVEVLHKRSLSQASKFHVARRRSQTPTIRNYFSNLPLLFPSHFSLFIIVHWELKVPEQTAYFIAIVLIVFHCSIVIYFPDLK